MPKPKIPEQDEEQEIQQEFPEQEPEQEQDPSETQQDDGPDLQAMADEDSDLITEEEEAELDMPKTPSTKHYANLADGMEENELDKIAQDLIEQVESDDESRADWWERVKRGIRNLGVSEKTFGGADFEGASRVVHPVLMEAVTQFQSRAIQEMWPSAGPVNVQVLGQNTEERGAQAQRVKDYMNFLYTVEMTEAFTEEDNMLLRLPISGSCFKKMYYDPLKKRLTSMFVEPSDFIVEYSTKDLVTSPRFTHRIREYENDVKKKELTGHYVKGKETDHHDEDTDKPIIIDEIDDTEGKTRTSYATTSDGDDRVTVYEVYVDYNVEEPDNPDALLKPYIITVDRDEQTVKRIQRNWKPDDIDTKKRIYFTHYKFTPGLGYYGYGFLHLIGGAAMAATGVLRSLLDAAAFANMQGGFRSRDSRLPGGDEPISPGQWKEVNSSAEELSKGFFPLPYKEPSATLFNLLGYLDDKASHLVGITDLLTGDTNAKNAPVGTTAMLLEQGMKVFTSIHKRLHESHKLEFRIMAELVYEYMPDEGYPYLLGQEEGTLLPNDFDERIDVIPVADPNVSSTAQRVAKAQSVLEVQVQLPEVVNSREAALRMFNALNVENVDALVGSEDEMAKQAQDAEEEQAHVKRIRELEIEKLEAEIAKIKSDAIQGNIDSTASALDGAAGIASNTELVAIADSLLDSAGFEDLSGGLFTGTGEPNILPNGAMPGPVAQPPMVPPGQGPMPPPVAQPGPVPEPTPEQVDILEEGL